MTNPLPPIIIVEADNTEAQRVAGLFDNMNVYHMFNIDVDKMTFDDLSENLRQALFKSTEMRVPVIIYRHLQTKSQGWSSNFDTNMQEIYAGQFARILQRHGIYRLNLLAADGMKAGKRISANHLKVALDYAEALRADTPRWAADMGITCFVGSTRPEYILCGDTFNPQKGSTYSWPFHRSSGSGPFLERALQNNKLSTATPSLNDLPLLAIVNVNDEHSDIVMNMLTTAGDVPIVALGELASKTLDTLGYKHSTALHPAHVKRFNRMSIENYGLSIAMSFAGEMASAEMERKKTFQPEVMLRETSDGMELVEETRMRDDAILGAHTHGIVTNININSPLYYSVPTELDDNIANLMSGSNTATITFMGEDINNFAKMNNAEIMAKFGLTRTQLTDKMFKQEYLRDE